jgi:CheY-like chemotaxis protein
MTNSGKKVLVAEDNAALATVVRFHLERAGFSVTVARNGQDAWEQLQEQTFDILVTDQQMPFLSGSDLCARLRDIPQLAPLPVVMLTAKGLEMELGFVRDQLGVKEVLPKPFSVRQLVSAVENSLTPATTTQP